MAERPDLEALHSRAVCTPQGTALWTSETFLSVLDYAEGLEAALAEAREALRDIAEDAQRYTPRNAVLLRKVARAALERLAALGGSP